MFGLPYRASFVEIKLLFNECGTFDFAILIVVFTKLYLLSFFRTGLMMRLNAMWLLYSLFRVQIGMNMHSEELIRPLWVSIDIFGHLFVMIAMKYGITINCFEILIKIEYSNTFFAALSFVGMESGFFLPNLWRIGKIEGAYWA